MELFNPLFVLLLIGTVSTKAVPECPPPIEIDPCTCKNVAYGVSVVCANMKSNDLLIKTFRRLSGFHFDNLLLHNMELTEAVHEDIFKGMAVNALQIEVSKLRFKEPAFGGLEQSLKQLKIMKCTEIGTDFKIAHLEKLQELYFSENKKDSVDESWLKNSAPNIRAINLDNNEIRKVEENAFSQMSSLEQISLADNRISTVSRNIFPRPAPKLFKMDLSHNVLKELPSDFFADMPSLAQVVLSGNELTHLPADTWLPIWNNLNSLLLYENPIICDERIQWMRELRKPPMMGGTCVEPAGMAGKLLKNLRSAQ